MAAFGELPRNHSCSWFFFFGRDKSTPAYFEKYRNTPPIFNRYTLAKVCLLLAESSIYTTNLYHDTVPIVLRYFCRSIRSGVVGTLPIFPFS